jgi:hypothetical protein
VFVNDNWHLASDVDMSGTLTNGDLVDNSLDTMGAATVSGTFGADAFSDLTAAVAAADVGGTVHVLEGEYTGDVAVNKSLTIDGANAGISAGAEAGVRVAESVLNGGLQITADNVTVDGLTIAGGTDIGGDIAGIYFAAGTSGHAIINNVITGNDVGRGILSTFNGDNDNILIQNNDIGHWISGVFNQTNDGVEVIGNLIHDNTAGVANDLVNDVLVAGNQFAANDEAIGTLNSTGLTAVGNDLADNLTAIANYGGDEVTAISNFWGTVDPDEIAALVDGAVLASLPLAQSPFAALNLGDLVFSGAGGVMLTVNPDSGDFTFTDGADLSTSGTGARIKNGMVKIHTHDEEGRKIDIKGTVDGDVDVSLKHLGMGVKKMSFALTAEAAVHA